MWKNCAVTLLLLGATVLGSGCPGKAPDQTATLSQIRELRTLGRHAEADVLADKAGIKEDTRGLERTQSYQETMDGGDDPLVPGCVCCYGDPKCESIVGRSVDECYPGGEGKDDLSENIAETDCVLGAACAKRKRYKCSDVLKGSECRLRKVKCCGVETTSAFCILEL